MWSRPYLGPHTSARRWHLRSAPCAAFEARAFREKKTNSIFEIVKKTSDFNVSKLKPILIFLLFFFCNWPVFFFFKSELFCVLVLGEKAHFSEHLYSNADVKFRGGWCILVR